MIPRVMVSPSLFALSDALASATGTARADWQERLADILREPDGTVPHLAWWTASDGKRHFRIGPPASGAVPPIGRV